MNPGDHLDGYEILRRIARGGFGEVWLCRSDALADFRALKFIAADNGEMLDTEFQALAHYRKVATHLRSRHLVPIEHVGRNGAGLYYVMPLADGTGEDPRDPDWQPVTLASIVERQRALSTWFSCEQIAG